MLVRILKSEWVMVPLTLWMVVCVGMAVHDDRPATTSERLLANSSVVMTFAWLFARALVWVKDRRDIS